MRTTTKIKKNNRTNSADTDLIKNDKHFYDEINPDKEEDVMNNQELIGFAKKIKSFKNILSNINRQSDIYKTVATQRSNINNDANILERS